MASRAAVLAVALLLLVGVTLQGCTPGQKQKERQAQTNPAPYEEEDHGKHHETDDAGMHHEREGSQVLLYDAKSEMQGCGCGNPKCNCLPNAAPATLLARGRGCNCGNPDCNCWTPATLAERAAGPRAPNCNCTASHCAAGCHCRVCICRTPEPAPAELASEEGRARGCNCGNPGCNCWTPATLVGERVEGPRAPNCHCTASHCAAGCHCRVCICRTPESAPAELAGEGGGARGCNCGNPDCNCWTPAGLVGERAGGRMAMPAAATWLSEAARQGASPLLSVCAGFLLGALCTLLLVRICAPAPQGPAREPLIRTT